MEPILIALIIGLLAGIASGAFGIGGAAVTAPLMRILLDSPGHVAVGTPLPLVIPMALSGLYVFHKMGAIRMKVILTAGIVGSIFSVLGAFLTMRFSGSEMMLFIAMILFLSSLLLFSKLPRPSKKMESDIPRMASIGALCGFVSGFLGIGGGGFLVPLFMLLLGLSVHEAIACSLGTIILYAIPGSVTHLMLNHIDVGYLLPILVFGVIGAQLGSRFVMNQDAKKTKLVLAAFYLLLGLILVLNESFVPVA
ncbi:TPA: sulfite exporter TauE/SafE family protein [Candidatus Micrarchaeota archaeon]|nr:sulfite exporter TauE/SafE family protein [Candidatus Micrarchaeota archaeon]